MKISAGILPFRRKKGRVEVYLVHMGGPYWRNKPQSWSIAKGLVEEGEELSDAAKREFEEETGLRLDIAKEVLIPLGEVKISGKRIVAWAIETDLPTDIRSNTFEIEWPPKSGKMVKFPEADRAEWMKLDVASSKIVASQLPFLDRLAKSLSS